MPPILNTSRPQCTIGNIVSIRFSYNVNRAMLAGILGNVDAKVRIFRRARRHSGDSAACSAGARGIQRAPRTQPALGPGEIRRCESGGALPSPCEGRPAPRLLACAPGCVSQASLEVYADVSARRFQKGLGIPAALRNEEYLRWQVAGYSYDTFMIRSRPSWPAGLVDTKSYAEMSARLRLTPQTRISGAGFRRLMGIVILSQSVG